MRSYEQLKRLKVKSEDRILKLKPMKGGAAKTSSTTVDSRLFTGGNDLHVIKDMYGMWTYKYDDGAVPGALKRSFTTPTLAIDFARKYFLSRNVEIYEIIE